MSEIVVSTLNWVGTQFPVAAIVESERFVAGRGMTTMQQQSFYETETLSTLLNSGLYRLGLPPSYFEKIANRISDEDAAKLNKEMVEILKTLPPSAIEMEEDDPPPDNDSSKLSSRIWRQANAKKQPTKMLFFRIKDAGPAVAIGLAGFAIALATLSPAAITSGMQTVKAVYDNVVTLKSPEDDDAMSVYDALLKWAAAQVDSTASGIRAADIGKFDGPNEDQALKGLKRLKDLGLAEVTVWGDSGGDLNDGDNLWRHRV
jgi:hypothetical protein